MPLHSQANAVFSNRSFVDDESNPPSYSSIYPITNDKDTKTSNTSTTTTTGNIFVANSASNNPNANLTSNLFQNSTQEPISYDELYSTRFLFQNGRGAELNSDVVSVPNTVFIQPYQHHHHNQSNPSNAANNHLQSSYSQTNRVRKQFHIIFTKSYLLKHFIFISVSSMMIILFQIILMNNQSILSHLAGGLWCGLTNLFTLLITIITLRYAKVWLLIISIILHFMCLTISLGSFVVINSVAASRYGTCSYNYPFYENNYDKLEKNTSCFTINLKYANIAMIILGATCMVMFVSFFIKLVAAFNNIHSSRE